jgi:hypothetical protein
MTNNTDKEKWINEVMDSTRGMARAVPPDGFFAGITSKLDRPIANVVQFPIRQWTAAAILLLALNLGSAAYFMGRNKQTTQTTTGNPLATEMQLETTYNY